MTRTSRLRPLARAVLRTQPDDRLVALSREGREAAFEEIVRRYRPGLVAFAAAFAPPDRAEDVVQESLMRSWKALKTSTEDIHLKPWLYTIVRNRALNARRDARPHEQLSENIDGVRGPSEIALTNEELSRAVTAVGALPENQRKALVRSALEGRTHQQIAVELGYSPGAVRQLIHRGRVAVREGVGLVVPLPLVRALTELGSGEAVATGAAAGGATIASAAGGASLLTKATTLAVVGAIAAGSGVAIKRAADDHGKAGPGVAEAAVKPSDGPGTQSSASAGAGAADTVSSAGDASPSPNPSSSTSSNGEQGDSTSGQGSGEPGTGTNGGGSGSSGGGHSDDGGATGPDPSHDGNDDGGPSSGPGDGGPGGGEDGSESGHGGHGSGDDPPESLEPPEPPEAEESEEPEDNSGPGSGSSSGHGSSSEPVSGGETLAPPETLEPDEID